MGLLGRIKNFIRDQKINRVHAKHREKFPEQYRRYDEIITRFREKGGLKHGFQAYKLFSLEQVLMKEKPKSIIELGTGTTTPIFYDFIRHHNASLTCCDESKKWLDNSSALAGINNKEDASDVELICTGKKVDRNDDLEIGYDVDFGRSFDLVFIDGPSLRIDGQKHKKAVNSNVFDICSYGLPKLIVVDIRSATVEAIKRRIGKNYDCTISDVIRDKISDGYNYLTIFKLKK